MSACFVYLFVSVVVIVSGFPSPRDFEDNLAEESINTQLVPKVESPYGNKEVVVEGNGGSDYNLHITPVYAEPGIILESAQTTTAVTGEETASTTEKNEGTTDIYASINGNEPNNENINGVVEIGGHEAKHSENLELSEELEDYNHFESEQIQEEVNDETSEIEGSDESVPVEEVESDGDSSVNDSSSTIDYGNYEESEEKFGDSYEYRSSEGSDENTKEVVPL